jgi:hypothetical protein
MGIRMCFRALVVLNAFSKGPGEIMTFLDQLPAFFLALNDNAFLCIVVQHFGISEVRNFFFLKTLKCLELYVSVLGVCYALRIAGVDVLQGLCVKRPLLRCHSGSTSGQKPCAIKQ